MRKIKEEIIKKIGEINKNLSAQKDLSEEDMTLIFLASILEEEGHDS